MTVGSSDANRRRLIVCDPARGEAIAELAIDAPEQVAAATAAARLAQRSWSQRTPRERARLLKRARKRLVRGRSEIFELLERETGKTRTDVLGELFGLCMELGHVARRAPRWLRPTRVSAMPMIGKKARVHYRPRGVVGVISPWNAPLTLSFSDAIPALLSGNAVLIKPSELTPLTVRKSVELMNQVLPPGLLQVVIGEGETGTALVDCVDMVCVTGSPTTGKRVMERASRRLTPGLLELGGKDPMIVLEDADLDRAARGAAFGSCLMTGQVCMSVERIYVERSVADTFTRKLVERMSKLRFGTSGGAGEIDFGPFIHPGQIDIVERQIADAVERGAVVLTGGKCESTGSFLSFPPTVLTGVDHEMAIMKEESFGPVVAVMEVADSDEAIALANDSVYGLSSSVWTRDIERGIAIAQRLEVGTTCINECVLSAGIHALPFGGVKESGIGTRHGGAEGLRQFCVAHALWIEARSRRSEPAWFPYSAKSAQRMDRLIGLLFGH
jgi:succinate-semialdehyde dehydrogenase/glutarate-semialdehyde dehydrogenase